MPPKKEAAPPAATTVDPSVQLQQNAFVRSALEATNQSLKSRLAELEKDVDVLRDTRQQLARDAGDFLDYATKELRLKEDELTAQKELYHKLKADKDAEIKELKASMSIAAAEAQQRHENMVADFTAQLKERDARLDRAQEFLQLRDQFEAQLEELHNTIDREREESQEKLADAERRLVVEKKTLEREQESRFNELKRMARAEIMRSLDDDTKRLIHESRTMSKELTMQTQECKTLSDERTALGDARKTLQRDVELLREAEREWASRSADKERSNKELTARCGELEVLLTQERRDRVAEYAGLMRAFERETEDMRLELAGLRSLMALKNRELRTIKKLAQIVLNQRTEVEQFFLDALTQVKLDIARKKADAFEAAAASAHASSSDLQPVLRSPGGNRTSRVGAGAASSSTKSRPVTMQLTVPADGSAIPAAVTLPELTAAARRQTPSGTLMSPPRNAQEGLNAATAARAAAAGAGSSKVDIAELSPEDRERVLRLLFAKINNMDTRPVAQRAAEQQQRYQHDNQQQHQQQYYSYPPPSPGAQQVPRSQQQSQPRASPAAVGPRHTNAAPEARFSDSKTDGGFDGDGGPPDGGGGVYGISGPFGLAAELPPELRELEFRSPPSRSGAASSVGTPGRTSSRAGAHLQPAGTTTTTPASKSKPVNGDDDIDSGALAAALGAKAQERVHLAAAIRQQQASAGAH